LANHSFFRVRKYFPQDKNYILYGAQYDLQEELLSNFILCARKYYLDWYNPLGLIDDTVRQVQKYKPSDRDIRTFNDFYQKMSAVYRYYYGSNQLEFLFDGMDHYTKYAKEWEEKFNEWTTDFFQQQHLLKTVLRLTVFSCEGHGRTLAENRLKTFLSHHFDLKFYKYKGIVSNVA